MTYCEAVRALFNQNRTEVLFGREAAQASRVLASKRKQAKKIRERQRIAERETPNVNG